MEFASTHSPTFAQISLSFVFSLSTRFSSVFHSWYLVLLNFMENYHFHRKCECITTIHPFGFEPTWLLECHFICLIRNKYPLKILYALAEQMHSQQSLHCYFIPNFTIKVIKAFRFHPLSPHTISNANQTTFF